MSGEERTIRQGVASARRRNWAPVSRRQLTHARTHLRQQVIASEKEALVVHEATAKRLHC